MYRNDDLGVMHAGGGAVARLVPRFGPIDPPPARRPAIAVDLGRDIGSARWWWGVVSLGAMVSALVHVAPPLAVPRLPTPAKLASAKPAPVAVMRPALRVAPPREPATIDLAFAVESGEGLAALLRRQGADPADVSVVAGLVTHERLIPAAGTPIAMTLGARPAPGAARPIARIGYGARIDLAVAISRRDGRLVLDRAPIPVDRTPIRLSGAIGASLYRAAREAGASASAVSDYLQAIAPHVGIEDIAAGDRFDMVLEHARAVTGEEETGRLLYAGLTHRGGEVRLLRWAPGKAGDDAARWYDATGAAERGAGMELPVDGQLTSAFGMRFHPILGFTRMHQGIDLAAPEGTPIVAAADGVVTFAGWHGGHGNYVLVDHGGGAVTGYGHMSRFTVAPGERVRRGELIGYVGSTGLSTGPHCHFEVFRDSVAVDPATADLASVVRVPAGEIKAFRARMAALTALPESHSATAALP